MSRGYVYNTGMSYRIRRRRVTTEITETLTVVIETFDADGHVAAENGTMIVVLSSETTQQIEIIADGSEDPSLFGE